MGVQKSKIRSPVRAKSTRLAAPAPAEPSDPFYKCCCCGKVYERQVANFSGSQSTLFRGNNGRFPICHKCVDDMYDHYCNTLGSPKEAMKRVCIKLDMFWHPQTYDTFMPKCSPNASKVKYYINKINLSYFLGKTYDDSLDIEHERELEAREEWKKAKIPELLDEARDYVYADLEAHFNQEFEAKAADLAEDYEERLAEITSSYEAQIEELKSRPVVVEVVPEEDEADPAEDRMYAAINEYRAKVKPPTMKTIKFWGPDFSPEVYHELDMRFDKWTGDLPKPLDTGSEALYKQICILEYTINKNSVAGKNIEATVKAYNDLIGSVNQKPSQKQVAEVDEDFDALPLGVGIKICENSKPIPKPLPELEDVDNVAHFISVYLLGHLCRMLNIKNAYSKMYEDEMARLRVDRPELEGEDDESTFDYIFGDGRNGDGK